MGFALTSIPPGPRGSVARLIYGGPSGVLIAAFLEGANGPFKISPETWRVIELLRHSGSRFI